MLSPTPSSFVFLTCLLHLLVLDSEINKNNKQNNKQKQRPRTGLLCNTTTNVNTTAGARRLRRQKLLDDGDPTVRTLEDHRGGVHVPAHVHFALAALEHVVRKWAANHQVAAGGARRVGLSAEQQQTNIVV